MMKYELVLGLEIHMQLSTSQKMFCSCANKPFGSEPNSHVCPVCLGLPGALPVPNKEAIEKSQVMAHALGSRLRDEIIFERKNYFYPDLPKAYQLTTPHYPISEGGEYVMLFPVSYRHTREGGDLKQEIPDSHSLSGMTIKWREIHIEEDTAKSSHGGGKTRIDFNKSGVPLLEMVTEPVFTTIEQAVQFAKEVQMVARYTGASDADMEKGQLRLEANISLRKNGETELPDYRVELKNINSFMFMKNALEAEITRQTKALDAGEILVQETRGYNEDTKETFTQRGKEDAHDYRYFPEPDIPPVRVHGLESRDQVMTPRDIVEKLKKEGVRDTYVPVIITDKQTAEFALKSIEVGKKEGLSADMIAGEMVNKKIDVSQTTPEKLVSSLKEARSSIVSDDGQIETWVKQALEENPKAAEDIKSGKMAAMGAIIGAVMRLSSGKADAKKVSGIISSLIKS